nr:serine/threonine-protein kinase [Luteolibacter marinus]
MSGLRTCQHCGAVLQSTPNDGFCPACLLDQVLETSGESPAPGDFVPEQAGDRVGRYTLLEQIGEGGFGVVFRARQNEPVRREVALKVIKPGMDSRELIARFEVERQALALMDHPHIAKVLDAGTTPLGRPYFVMELVDGIPVTDYCNREKLPIPDRLKNFAEVCDAVQHAHQKGIIHRDLKPSNILISTGENQRPFAKVIDFGVAKAICTEVANETFFTRFGRLIGTPQYMSPEQAEIHATDIDTRSDIYALGAVLYEILTGVPPLDGKTLSSAGYDKMRKMIREQVPLRPSARLRASEPEVLQEVAEARGTDGPKLLKQLHGDLNWIVMKALEKDRNRRYDTAHSLAMDMRRHLQGLPVSAGPPGAGYRVGKFVSRNRTAVTGAALVMMTLIVGIVVATLLYFNALEAEKASKREHRASLLREATADRWSGDSGGRAKSLQALVEAAKIEIGRDLRDEAIACLAWIDVREVNSLSVENIISPQATYDPEHRWCAVATKEGDIRILSLPDGTPVATLPGAGEPLALSRQGNRLVACRRSEGEASLNIWDWKTGRLAAAAGAMVQDCFEVLDDGSGIAVGRPGGGVEILDWTGSVLNRFELPGIATAVSYSPTQKVLAANLRKRSDHRGDIAGLLLVGPDSAEPVQVNEGTSATALDWDPSGRFLAVGEDNGSVWVFDRSTASQAFRTTGHHDDSKVTRVEWSRDGSMFATGCLGSEIRLWDGRQGTMFCKHKAWAGRFCFSPDGSFLGPIVRLDKIKTLEVLQSKVCHRSGGHRRTDGINAAAWSTKAVVLATAATDGVRLWNREARELAYLDGLRDPRGLAFSDDRLYIADADGIVTREFTMTSPTTIALGPAIAFSDIKDCQSIALAANHGLLAVASRSGMWLVDLKTGDGRRLEGPEGASVVSITPTQDWLAAAPSRPASGAFIWNLPAGDLVEKLPTEGPANLAFSTVEPSLVTGDSKAYRFWRLQGNSWAEDTGLVIHNEMADLPGRVLFSPRATALTISYERSLLRVLDPHDLSILTEPSFDEQWPLAISPDGMLMVNEGRAGRLFLWDLAEIRRELARMGIDWTHLRPFPHLSIPVITSATVAE